jgi:hypothetical protein
MREDFVKVPLAEIVSHFTVSVPLPLRVGCRRCRHIRGRGGLGAVCRARAAAVSATRRLGALALEEQVCKVADLHGWVEPTRVRGVREGVGQGRR